MKRSLRKEALIILSILFLITSASAFEIGTSPTLDSPLFVGTGKTCIAFPYDTQLNGKVPNPYIGCSYDSLSGRIIGSVSSATGYTRCAYACSDTNSETNSLIETGNLGYIILGGQTKTKQIGQNKNCVAYINNLGRIWPGYSSGMIAKCSYDPSTGLVTGSCSGPACGDDIVQPGLTCNYICVSNTQSNTKKEEIGIVQTTTKQIGLNRNCVSFISQANLAMYNFGSNCSYNPATGIVIGNFNDGTSWLKCGYMCLDDKIICLSDNDCNDNNPVTEDKCINSGTSNSYCQHNTIRCSKNSDCGSDGFTGDLFCSNGNVVQNYNTFICNSPGSSSSFCSNNVTTRLKVACTSGQICSNAQCISTQCSNLIDDDSDKLTDSQDPGCWDNINDPNTYNPLLNNESRAGIACFTNAQCGQDGFTGNKYCSNGNVVQDYKTFSCISPGKGSSSCSSSTSQRLIQTCSDACSNGACVSIICRSASDCNDNDPYTIDNCTNPGSVSSQCTHITLNCISNEDCGFSGFFGSEFCSNNDVFKNFQRAVCVNPGSASSRCDVSVAPTFLNDCGETTCDSFSSNYCKSGNVYHSRVCNQKGCNNGACVSNAVSDEQLVMTCSKGCASGQCNPDCSSDSDCTNGKICSNNVCVQSACSGDSQCGTNSFLNQLSCVNGNVFDKYITYVCVNPRSANSHCTNNTENKQIKVCVSGCANGQCIASECVLDSDCPLKYYSDKYCKNNNVFKDFHEFKCINNKCEDQTSADLVKNCDYKCRDGSCFERANGTAGIEEDSVETSPLVIYHDENITSFSFSEDINQTVKKIGTSSVSVGNTLLYLIVAIFIIILIIIIIIVILLLTGKKKKRK